jgi:hypothetical protein
MNVGMKYVDGIGYNEEEATNKAILYARELLES